MTSNQSEATEQLRDVAHWDYVASVAEGAGGEQKSNGVFAVLVNYKATRITR